MWLIFQIFTDLRPATGAASKNEDKIYTPSPRLLLPEEACTPARNRRPVEPDSKISRHRRIERLHLFGQTWF
jgi:hypothetical protein